MITLEVQVPVGEDADRAEICGRLVAWMIRMSMDTHIPLMVKVKETDDEKAAVTVVEEE